MGGRDALGGEEALTSNTPLTTRLIPWKLCRQWAKRPRALYREMARDIGLWLNYCWTLDEDDPDRPIKRLMGPPEKSYLWELVRLWVQERVLYIVKSRQMRLTWLLGALHLGNTALHEGRRTFIQAEKLEKACGIMERLWFIVQHMPPDVLPRYDRTMFRRKTSGIVFPETHSIIEAVPQGAGHLRSYTASGWMCDEAAHQNQAEFAAAYAAARPTLGKSGKVTIVSSAAPGTFEALWKDEWEGN